jgi:D-beta-D-heptose 7-phosphate kinase/D-beta-D-heptose 1-phosphate adenosyltransferase
MSHASAFQERLSRFSSAHVLCVGDVMLDHFVYGTVERISPEAPIPVLKVQRETQMLGGAGNVVRNIAALGAAATLVAVIGNDSAGQAISGLISSEPNLTAAFLTISDRPTSLKVRHVASNQQMLRTDRETSAPLSAAEEAGLVAILQKEIANADIIILSDYAKGVLTPGIISTVCSLARAQGKRVIADPKSVDFTRYMGVHILTPNARELAAATGLPVATDDTAAAAAARAVNAAGLEAVLVTRSEQGMTLVSRDAPPAHFPAQAREVFDVSGAGDTVIATLAVTLAAGAALPEAVAIANIAAGIVVGKSGTAVVRPDEIAQSMQSQDFQGAEAKVRTLGAAIDLVQTWRTRGHKIGFTNGCFDLIHPGHISLLAQARGQCDRLVVGLNTDASIKRLKGQARPINSELARAIVLAALESVDAVVLFDQDTPIDLIKAIRPDVLVKGADYTVDKVVGGDFVTAAGGRVFLAELTPGQSTTNIVQRMATPTAQETR